MILIGHTRGGYLYIGLFGFRFYFWSRDVPFKVILNRLCFFIKLLEERWLQNKITFVFSPVTWMRLWFCFIDNVFQEFNWTEWVQKKQNKTENYEP